VRVAKRESKSERGSGRDRPEHEGGDFFGVRVVDKVRFLSSLVPWLGMYSLVSHLRTHQWREGDKGTGQQRNKEESGEREEEEEEEEVSSRREERS
jgi:hypothetical protein